MEHKILLEEKQAIELFLKHGNEESFGVLFEYVYPKVYRYFVLRGLESAIAEELSQNVLLTVYREATKLQNDKPFLGWLFKVARNEMLQHFRRTQGATRRSSLEPLEAALYLIAPDVSFESGFAEQVSQLEQPERDLLTLLYVEGLSYEELATALELPLGTVKWRIFNAKKKLAASLPIARARRATNSMRGA
jgi:RNA polymerase sigma-70 factor, ECF subfamily